MRNQDSSRIGAKQPSEGVVRVIVALTNGDGQHAARLEVSPPSGSPRPHHASDALAAAITMSRNGGGLAARPGEDARASYSRLGINQ